MDSTKAQIIVANLRERIEIGDDGKFRLLGTITQMELAALDFFVSGQAAQEVSTSRQSETLVSAPGTAAIVRTPPDSIESASPAVAEDHAAVDHNVTLDLSALSLPESDPSHRVCMDFGTAMSKATFVHDNEGDGMEDIQALKLGIPGDQEEIDEMMLVSSVFIDSDGLIWFGKHALDRSQVAPEGQNSRIDNIKRALSEDNLGEPVSTTFNPTAYSLTYEDIVLAYLAFFTWTIGSALESDVDSPEVARNFKRRFAMPCFPRPSALKVSDKLRVLLGEAQILADTFGDDIHLGLPLTRFLSALKQLRSEKRSYPFIDGSVTEPLGVAGSLLSWQSSQDSLALVVDIGAGTSDFSLYRLNVVVDEDGEIVKSIAGEVEGTARGITEAGNHLDKILMALILKKSGVDSGHPKYRNITHALERDIRFHKESLFGPSSEATIQLYTGDVVDISLDEFLTEPAVRSFEDSLRSTLVDILESAHPDWINWVRVDPRRRLTVVLAGGGATLPMARSLAQGTVAAHGTTIPVAPAKAFPDWLRDDYPDLEEHYPRMAVSLGGARRNTIQSMGVLRSTGISGGGYTLERFSTRGN